MSAVCVVGSSLSSPVCARTNSKSSVWSLSEMLNATKWWCFVVVTTAMVLVGIYYCVVLVWSATIAFLSLLTGVSIEKGAVSSTLTNTGLAAFSLCVLLLFLSVGSYILMAHLNQKSNSTILDLEVPTKRNYHFAFAADKISNWHRGGFLITSFWNALSIFFPPGERMFIEAVRNHKQLIEEEQAAKGGNEKLLQSMNAFISQEGVHGREHECYNEILMDRYPVVRYLDRLVEFITGGVTKYRSNRFALGGTIALEHWTAMLAGLMLNSRRYALAKEDVDDEDGYSLVWKWHAMEEVEHRAVAYDVWRACYPDTFRNYILRCFSQVISTFMFWLLVISFFLIIVATESPKYFFHVGEWFDLFYFLFRKPGIFSSILSPLLHYFRRDFHPAQQNNEDYSKLYEELKEKVDKFHHTAKTYQPDKSANINAQTK